MRKWSLHSALSIDVGLGLPCKLNKENNNPTWMYRVTTNTNQEERPSHNIPIYNFVKCPSSHQRNKRNALSQYVCTSYENAPQRYAFFLEERSLSRIFYEKLAIIL